MTCIIGYLDKKNDTVYIGGDSMGSNGYTQGIYLNGKVFHNETIPDVIMGVCGSYRNMDLLRYSKCLFPEIDFYKNPEINHQYMVNTFIPSVISLFQNNNPSASETNRGCEFIIGVKNKLFIIQSDYSVLEPQNGIATIGSGEETSYGSMYTTTKHYPDIHPVDHIKYALKAKKTKSMGVHKPFIIINTKNKDEVIKID